MGLLNGVYTQLFNNLHGSAGHLFQGRYKSILIQKAGHLLEVCRYVVLKVRGQVLLGEEDFVDYLVDHFKGAQRHPEISRSQRYTDRPSLEKLFSKKAMDSISRRNKAIVDAVEKHGYRQREVADHSGMFFTSISGILRTTRP